MKSAPLSKTRFAAALQCPRKLDYGRDSRYFDAAIDNELLKSLAEGGHQVGELARRMFPDGHLVDGIEQDTQIRQTAELLIHDTVTIFEATIRHGNLLVRADVLEKHGNEIRLIEVKAKGVDPAECRFLVKNGKGNPALAEWRPYLYDVAFQTYVLRLAYPNLRITPYLMLLDTTAPVAVNGLHSMLAAETLGRSVAIRVDEGFDIQRIDPPLLRRYDVSEAVRRLLAYPVEVPGRTATFADFVSWVAGTLAAGGSFAATVGSQCKACQYYVDPSEATPDSRSGWAECMEAHTGEPPAVRRAQTLFGLYRLDAGRLGSLLQAKHPLSLAKVQESAVGDSVSSEEWITLSHRRQLQLAEARGVVSEPVIRIRTLRDALRSWKTPLHFIDFETTRPALPYHGNRTPYDQVLFQFSHHVMDGEGRVAHRSQCLNAAPGEAPSLPVVRALRDVLMQDSGTVVHWWTHEDTVLKDIRQQIELDSPPDAAELTRFIDALIGGDASRGRLVDLGRLVSKTVFYPGTAGSSSIKKVLPAALRCSDSIRNRYGQPIYGTPALPSLNFKDWVWVSIVNNFVQDPYERLDPLFSDPQWRQAVSSSEEAESGDLAIFVANGGAALIAFDQLQRSDLPDTQRRQLEAQLLRYCELDTFAMVMVYEALREACEGSSVR